MSSGTELSPTSIPPVFEVDEPSTWNPPVRELVERWHREVPQAEYPGDLAIPGNAQTELISLLEPEQAIRALHFTRLLPHEIDDIRLNGLRAFTTDLFDGRLDRARELGYLSTSQAERLRAGQIGVAERHRAEGRWDTVHLTVGNSVLGVPSAVERLLKRWGGEGVFFSATGADEVELLQALGKPVVVICDLTVRGVASWRFVPVLAKVLLAIRRGMQAYADLEIPRSLHHGEVIDVLGPGTAFYDTNQGLPSA